MRARADIPCAGDYNREFLGGLRLRFGPSFCSYGDKIHILSIKPYRQNYRAKEKEVDFWALL